MQQSILTKIKLFLSRNRQNRIFRKFVHVLCCMVVFVTTYALILPAITLEQEAFCGKEAHEHTEACLQASLVPTLVCTPEKLNLHVHSNDCYSPEGSVLCGQADYVVHSHNSSCYDSTEELVCLLPERSSHVHGASCYIPGETLPEVLHSHSEDCYIQEKGELSCTQEEREGHAHSSQCYGPGTLLECGLTENHLHGEDCYSLPLSCTLSTEPHVHSDGCYTAGALQCSTPEYHSHADDCWDRTQICGQSEGGHQHSDNCWETNWVCESDEESHEHGESCTETRLVCGLTEESHYHHDGCYSASLRCHIPENHSHDQSCYDTTIICGKEAGQVHEHTQSCYGSQPQLHCQMAENHVHDSGCYNQVLTCELPEDPGHRHEDACYQWNAQLECLLEEGAPEPTEPPEPVLVCTEPDAPVHVHEESCFEQTEQTSLLLCQGGEDHQHTDACYTCGLEAHEHTLICYSDPEADVETPDIWEATFRHVTLTGDSPQDVVAIAETQIGYTESSRNYEVWEDNSIHGYTRYGDWFGSPHGDWCAMFVSFCLHYAEVEDMPLHWGVRPWIEELSSRGLYYSARNTKPQKGNLIFFDWEGDGLSDHVGIVAEVQEPQEHTGASVKAIEGNSSNMVRYQYYSPDDPVILGYGLLPGQERIPLEKDPITEEETSIIYYCGLEEHTHEDVCYDEAQNLICQLTEHSHSETCLEKPVTYNCGLEAHSHGDSCYDEAQNLICQLTEHSHSETCLEKPEDEYQMNTDILLGPVVTITAESIIAEGSESEEKPEQIMMFATGRTTTKSLTEYLSHEDVNGIYVFTLTNLDNTKIPQDEQDNYIVTAGTSYKLTMRVESPNGIAPGTYTYQLPDGLTIVGGTGKLEASGVDMGTWTVTNDGFITFVFNDNANRHSEVILSAEMSATFTNSNSLINFADQIKVEIHPPDSTLRGTDLVKFGKQGNGTDDQPNAGKIYWKIHATGHEGSHIPGSVLIDRIDPNSPPHSYTASDIQAGLTVGVSPAGGGWYWWIVSADDPALKWDENGWEYTMPTEYNGVQLGNDGWNYYIEYTSTPSNTNAYGEIGYMNTVLVDNKTVSGWGGFTAHVDPAGIVKTGNFVADENGGSFRWKITANIPGYVPGTIPEYDWYVSDELFINAENRVLINNTIDQAQITATYNGQKINVPHHSGANADANPIVWQSTYKSPDGSYCNIRFLSRCDCTATSCKYWGANGCGSMGEGVSHDYCLCWTISEPVTIEIVYETSNLNILKDYAGMNLVNRAELHNIRDYVDNVADIANRGTEIEEVKIPSIVNKRITQDYDGYIAKYTIILNESMLNLSPTGTPITIVDEMTDSLAYIAGSMVITTKDANGNTGTLTYGADYTLTYDGTDHGNHKHVLTIVIKNPQPVQYTMNYDTTLLIPEEIGNDGIHYSNSATVTIWGQELSADSQEKVHANINFTAKSYKVQIIKTAAGTQNLLPGAVFGLFNEAGRLITTQTTGADGTLLFETSVIDGIILREHEPCYIQEISAPEGFVLDNTKHWFYFCDSGNTCNKGNSVKEQHPNAVRLPGDEIGIFNLTNTMMGYELPATGGTGYELYTVGGWLLIWAAVLLLYSQRKCRKEDYQSS